MSLLTIGNLRNKNGVQHRVKKIAGKSLLT